MEDSDLHVDILSVQLELDEVRSLLNNKKCSDDSCVAGDDVQTSSYGSSTSILGKSILEPIRTVHHLSCTGGTLMTKCLAAMPNVMVLNETDPLSTLLTNVDKPVFTPSDVISLVRQGDPGVSIRLLSRLFSNNLDVIFQEMSLLGKRLLIRDHSHSQYLTGSEVESRPSVLEIIGDKFKIKSLVTVRDPVDSYISLRKSGWIHYEPATFDEYCRRYLLFLESYQSLELFRYEDFIYNPLEQVEKMCRELDLQYSDLFIDTFDAFSFSGDSGRTGSKILQRPKRKIDKVLFKECEESENYFKLIKRLGYDSVYS